MPTKTFHANGPAGVIAIGNYGTPQAAITSPQSYLSSLNFHSSLPYLTIKQMIQLGSMSFSGSSPSYSFDEPHYTKLEWTNTYAGSTSISNPLFFLVVNNVVYPNGYLYNISNTGYSHLFLIHSSGNFWITNRHTTYESAMSGLFVSSLEILIIG